MSKRNVNKVVEKLNIHMQKNKVVFLVYTIHKKLTQNRLKI